MNEICEKKMAGLSLLILYADQIETSASFPPPLHVQTSDSAQGVRDLTREAFIRVGNLTFVWVGWVTFD